MQLEVSTSIAEKIKKNKKTVIEIAECCRYEKSKTDEGRRKTLSKGW